MKYLQSVASNWFLILEFGLAAFSVYIVWKLYQSSVKHKNNAKVEEISDSAGVGKSEQAHKEKKIYSVVLIIIFSFALALFIIVRSLPHSPNPNVKNLNRILVTLQLGEPATVFDNALIIKLNKISPKNDNHYAVSATIISEGYPSQEITDESDGYTLLYRGKEEYQIQIVTADLNQVKLFVLRKSD